MPSVFQYRHELPRLVRAIALLVPLRRRGRFALARQSAHLSMLGTERVAENASQTSFADRQRSRAFVLSRTCLLMSISEHGGCKQADVRDGAHQLRRTSHGRLGPAVPHDDARPHTFR